MLLFFIYLLKSGAPPCYNEKKRKEISMKLRSKIAIILTAPILSMLLFPLIVIKAEKDGLGAMGLFFLLFFAVYPLLAAALGMLAGTRISLLWWEPIALSALFPLLFSIAIRDLVWDLYFYSAFYLPIGAISMLGMHLFLKNKKSPKSIPFQTTTKNNKSI